MKKITDGRVVVALCCLLAIAGIGVTNCYGVFTVPVCNALNLARSQFALTSTIYNATSALATLFTPRILFKLGLRKTILIGALLKSSGYVMLSLANNIYSMYFFYAVCGIGYGFLCMTVLFIVVNSYYRDKNGVATSVMMSFTGLAGTILSPVLANVIENNTWKMGYLLCAACCIMFSMPTIILGERIEIVKSYKVDAAQTSDNRPTNKLFVVLLSICFCAAHYQCILAQFFPSLIQEYGLSATSASLALSAAMIGNIAFKLIDGYLSDHIGVMPANSLMYGINMISALIFVIVRNPRIAIINAFLFGAIYAVSGMGMSLMCKYLFSADSIAQIYPFISLFGTIGYGASSVIIGAIYDANSSYDLALWISLILAIIMLITNIYIDRTNKTQKKTDMI